LCGRDDVASLLPWCAPSVLMGCSSGKLVAHGRAAEPGGMVLAHLTAGSPAVVANLWDVTDRDIDRFTDALLRTWLLGDRTRAADAAGPPRSPAMSNTDDGTQLWSSLLPAAIVAARRACRLQYLIGCAPVVYGLPVSAIPTPLASDRDGGVDGSGTGGRGAVRGISQALAAAAPARAAGSAGAGDGDEVVHVRSATAAANMRPASDGFSSHGVTVPAGRPGPGPAAAKAATRAAAPRRKAAE
jgi:hypothetical protein